MHGLQCGTRWTDTVARLRFLHFLADRTDGSAFMFDGWLPAMRVASLPSIEMFSRNACDSSANEETHLHTNKVQIASCRLQLLLLVRMSTSELNVL